MKPLPSICLYILVIILISSCVSQKKYDDLWSQKAALEVASSEKQDRITIIERELAQLQKDLSKVKMERSKADDQLQATQSKLDGLNQQYDDLLTNSDQLNKDFVEQQQRIRELEKVLEEKEQAVKNLKSKVSAALLNFKENDLTVEVKNGKVYVSLAEQLLFGSGSIKIDEKGVTALQQLAGVLKENQDINIVVEGHTDNVPVSKTSQYMKDNWDLSVMRATSIVSILTQSGVDSERITASGRGEHVPITSNDTADDRKKNRRTEIILTPKLDELFQILEGS
ncbi:MAG: OmpA family protein [Cyclobacteriaceae bacterium]